MLTANQIIHTHLYSDTAFNIIYGTYRYLSANWGSRQMNNNVEAFDIVRLDDNEIVFKMSRYYHRYNHSAPRIDKMETERDFIIWFSFMVKTVTQRLMKAHVNDDVSDLDWKRNCDVVINRFTTYKDRYDKNGNKTSLADHTRVPFAKVSELYTVYDIMQNREKRIKTALATEIIGEQLDPILTEMKTQMNNDIQELQKACELRIAELRVTRDNLKLKVSQKLEKYFQKLMDENRAKLLSEIEALKAQYNI